jgi:HAD superfamily hydrolase (TIGR01509 family)
MPNFIRPRYEEIFRNKKLILFDLDGTITETESLNYLLYKRALNKTFEVRLSREDWKKFFSGRTPEASLRDFLRSLNIFCNKTNFQYLMEEIRVSKERELSKIRKIELVDGFIKFAKKLRKEDLKIGLATSTTRVFTEIILAKVGIDHYFDEIITREDCNISKPNPDIYCYAMKIFKIDPRDTIIFEDSFSGLMAAVRSKAAVIQVGKQLARLNGGLFKSWKLSRINKLDKKCHLFYSKGLIPSNF